MNTELKPCPFCGSTDIEAGAYSLSEDCYVMCCSCNAGIETLVPRNGMNIKEHDEACIKRLKKLWNRRISDESERGD